MPPEEDHPLTYARSLFSNIVDWYKNADSKAQVLLTLDGVFVSFLSGSVFVKVETLELITGNFGVETWFFAGGMVIALVGSVYAALACMKSRLDDPDEITSHLAAIGRDVELQLQQKPETMWFFGHIAQLKDRERFVQRVGRFSRTDEIAALSSQIFLVSKNVLQKHGWVNRGFLLAGVALTLFLAAAVSYVIRAAT